MTTAWTDRLKTDRIPAPATMKPTLFIMSLLAAAGCGHGPMPAAEVIGAAWSPDPARAQVLFDGAPIMSVSHNPYLSSWIAVYSVPLSNDVVLRSAPALTGPWSEPLRLFVADPGASEGSAYDAQEHPQFAEERGRVLYITHSRPDGKTWFSARFPLIHVELRAASGG